MRRTVCFDDVLLVPQYSDIESRSEVDLSVPGLFDHLNKLVAVGKQKLTCPIIGSPMDTVMGVSAAFSLSDLGGFGVLHRYCSIEEARHSYVQLIAMGGSKTNVMVAIGATGDYLERATELFASGCRAFCIDVAHGHHVSVKKALETLRNRFGNMAHLMGGNVSTLESFNDLADWGCDSIRVGVGGGCFIPGTLITMANGTKKPIENVEIGDSVLTHTGEMKQVINLFERPFSDLLIKINDSLTCTLNHEIYVVENKDIVHINDENLHEFAKWIPAADLNENYSLVEII